MKTMIDNGGTLPSRSTPLAAGLDLYASSDHIMWPLSPIRIRTGVAFELPEGSVGVIWPRSGIGSRGFNVLGGVIDEDYRGFVSVLAVLLRWKPMRIRKGDRIAQLVIHPIDRPMPEEVRELSKTVRGAGDLGSSGR